MAPSSQDEPLTASGWQVWLLPAAITFLSASVFTGSALVAAALRETAQQPVLVQLENQGLQALDVRLRGLPISLP